VIRPSPDRRLRPAPGFTLIELLVVITIIAILVTLVAGVGVALTRNSRASQTQNVLLTLDRALSEYLAVARTPPKFDAEDYEFVPGENNVLTDYEGEEYPARPDTAVFLKQVKGFGEVDAIISSIPAQFLVPTIVRETTALPRQLDPTPSVVDGWKNDDWDEPFDVEKQQLIYYVHPDNKLAQALYGRCINNRPYFMSAGPDRKYGFRSETTQGASEPPDEYQLRVEKTVSDNIYSYRPDPFETDSAFFAQFR